MKISLKTSSGGCTLDILLYNKQGKIQYHTPKIYHITKWFSIWIWNWKPDETINPVYDDLLDDNQEYVPWNLEF